MQEMLRRNKNQEPDLEAGDGDISLPAMSPQKKKRGSILDMFAGKGILVSRFNGWSRYELVMALVDKGFEVRNAHTVPLLSLVDECDLVYKGQDMPPKSSPPEGYVKFRMHYSAGKIQNAWWSWKFRHVKVNKSVLGRSPSLRDIEQSHMEQEYGENDLEESEEDEDTDVEIQAEEADGVEDILDTMVEDVETDTEAVGVLSDAQKEEAVKLLHQLNLPYRIPNWAKARRSQDFLHPRKGGKGGTKFQLRTTTTGRHCTLGGCGEQCDLWGEGMVSEFAIYGSGVTNYFKFLKWATWMFGILAIITLPEIFLNIYGVREKQVIGSVSQTTIGNLANVFTNITVSVVTIPGCDVGVFGSDACTLSRTKVGLFYGIIDAAACLFLLCGFIWLRVYERIEEQTIDKNTIYAAMYTIQVTNLPKNCTDLLLTSHFNSILGGQFPIVSVHIAHRNAHQIKQCARRGDLIRAKNRLIIECRYHCTQAKYDHKNPEDKDKLVEKVKKFKLDALRKIRKVDEDIKKFDEILKTLVSNVDDPLVAFVTFEDTIGVEICCDLYRPLLFDKWNFDQRLLFEGKRLEIDRAPEPSVIIWENLEYGFWNRFGRKLLTFSAALLLLAVSLGCTISAKVFENEFNNAGGNDLCPINFYSLSNEEQLALVAANDQILHCYCENYGILSSNARNGICKEYFQQLLISQVFIVVASLVVIIIGALIEYFIRRFVDFEKHHSEDEKQRSIFLRLFILQYINGSVIFLVNNSKFLAQVVFRQESSYQPDFSSSWYANTGVEILIVQLGNMVFSQASTVYEYFFYHANLKAVGKSSTLALTQTELNKAHLGPEFEISYRYALILSSIFVCLTFSSGIPLLYSISALTFYLYFVTDKYAFIKLYRNPHRFSAQMGKQATLLIPLGIALHLYASVWVLSDKEIFAQQADLDASYIDKVAKAISPNSVFLDLLRRISLKQTFPLFCLGTLILAVYISYYLLRFFLRAFHMIRRLKNGDSEARERIEHMRESYEHGIAIPFTKAVQRNLIKGLASYNLLQNPRYKERFAITWNFAFKNHDLRSVLFDVNSQTNPDDDDDIARVDKLVRLEAKDKEILANLSRSTEFGVLGVAIRGKTSFEANGSQTHRSDETELSPRLSARSSPRLVLQKYASTMQRQKLFLEQINNSTDDLETADIEKITKESSIKGSDFDASQDLDLYLQASKPKGRGGKIELTTSNDSININSARNSKEFGKIGTGNSNENLPSGRSTGSGRIGTTNSNESLPSARSVGTGRIGTVNSNESLPSARSNGADQIETSKSRESIRSMVHVREVAIQKSQDGARPGATQVSALASKTESLRPGRESIPVSQTALSSIPEDSRPKLTKKPSLKKSDSKKKRVPIDDLPEPSSAFALDLVETQQEIHLDIPPAAHNSPLKASPAKPVVPPLNFASTSIVSGTKQSLPTTKTVEDPGGSKAVAELDKSRIPTAVAENHPQKVVVGPNNNTLRGQSVPNNRVPASISRSHIAAPNTPPYRHNDVSKSRTTVPVSAFAITKPTQSAGSPNFNRLASFRGISIPDTKPDRPQDFYFGTMSTEDTSTITPTNPEPIVSLHNRHTAAHQTYRTSTERVRSGVSGQERGGGSSADYFIPAPNSLGNYSFGGSSLAARSSSSSTGDNGTFSPGKRPLSGFRTPFDEADNGHSVRPNSSSSRQGPGRVPARNRNEETLNSDFSF